MLGDFRGETPTVGTPGENLGCPLHQMPLLNGSLLNLLDAIALSQSTEVPYRLGRNAVNPYYVYRDYSIKKFPRKSCHVQWCNRVAWRYERFSLRPTTTHANGRGGNRTCKAKLTTIADVCNGYNFSRLTFSIVCGTMHLIGRVEARAGDLMLHTNSTMLTHLFLTLYVLSIASLTFAVATGCRLNASEVYDEKHCNFVRGQRGLVER